MGIEIHIVGQCSHLLIRDKKVQIQTDIGLADTKHGNWSLFHLDVLSKKAISLVVVKGKEDSDEDADSHADSAPHHLGGGQHHHLNHLTNVSIIINLITSMTLTRSSMEPARFSKTSSSKVLSGFFSISFLLDLLVFFFIFLSLDEEEEEEEEEVSLFFILRVFFFSSLLLDLSFLIAGGVILQCGVSSTMVRHVLICLE